MAKIDKHPKVKPVVVRWVDSTGISGWSKYTASKMECTTVGHLVEKTKDRVVIALNRSQYNDGDYMEIPNVAIKSIKKLKE